MNAEGPRGNAGRGIETSDYHDSTAISNPLSSGDHDERPRRTLRAYQCAVGILVAEVA